jgi:hypothetical protein
VDTQIAGEQNERTALRYHVRVPGPPLNGPTISLVIHPP